MKHSELEYRAVQVLKRNPRITIRELAEELNVNRNTASKILRSVLRKVKLRVTVDAGPVIFAVGKCAEWCEECYPLINEDNMCVTRGSDLSYLLKRVEETKPKEVFISMKGEVGGSKVNFSLSCDYCGKEIHEGERYITYVKGRKTYFLCCTSCLREFKRMEHSKGDSRK